MGVIHTVSCFCYDAVVFDREQTSVFVEESSFIVSIPLTKETTDELKGQPVDPFFQPPSPAMSLRLVLNGSNCFVPYAPAAVSQ